MSKKPKAKRARQLEFPRPKGGKPVARRRARRRTASTPGPKPAITLAVVKRVSERFAHGVPLALALAAENKGKVNVETWKKAMQAHPEFSPHYEAAKGKFLADSMERLVKANDLKHLCWLLERRYSDLFPRHTDVLVQANAHAAASAQAGLPEDLVKRAREVCDSDVVSARERARVAEEQDHEAEREPAEAMA